MKLVRGVRAQSLADAPIATRAAATTPPRAPRRFARRMPMYVQIAAATGGVAASLSALLPLAHGDARPATISTAEIRDGMKGYGLTVFKGTEPERFDVEVVAVLRNFRPAQDLILIRTPHPRLDITKNVKGMSGSPIYLDGRLAGAYAYSLAGFQAEAVAGVTPIAPMLNELHRVIPPGFFPTEGARGALPGAASPGSAARHAANGASLPNGQAQAAPAADYGSAFTRFEGAAGQYNLDEHRRQLTARTLAASGGPGLSAQPVATPLLVGGVGPRTQGYLRELFGAVGLEALDAGGGGGAQDPNAPLHYVNGGALGVSMVSGDISMFGLGTVTYVDGNRVAGFGHPMMEAGATSLPTSIGRVHWIYASAQHSFKVGESARPLGTLVQDRQSAVVVDEHQAPMTFPLVGTIEGAIGAAKTRWEMRVAQEKFMSPGFVAAAISGMIEASTNERRDMSWRINSRVVVRGQAPVELEDFGVAQGGMPDAGDLSRSRLIRVVGDVVNNPFQNAIIESVTCKLTVQYTRDVLTLRASELLDTVVDAGGTAHIRVTLVPFSGPPTQRVLEVPIPRELAGKDTDIEIVPGYEVSPEVAAPESLAQLLANAPQQTNPRSLVALVRLPSLGVAYQGHVAPRLPAFAVDALRSQNGSLNPETFSSFARTLFPTDRYIDGRDKLRVKVRAKLD